MITFKKHTKEDIPLRVKWFSDPNIAKSLAGQEGYQTSLKKETEWFERYEKSKDKIFYTILCDNNSIGLVGLTNIKGDNAELFVAIGEENYWGRGIGFEAIKFIEEIACDKGLKKIKLSVDRENERAINLYIKASYVRTGSKDSEVLMEKAL